MPLKKIQFRPGINRDNTQYGAEYSWWHCDRIRFENGRPQKIGGWDKYADGALYGVPRSILNWQTQDLKNYLGIGTTKKFYVELGSTYFDITPIRATTAVGDVTFAATNGSDEITVTDALHGAALGDFVTYSGAVTLGGLITADVLNQEYQVASIIDGNGYTIKAVDTNGDTVTANASDTGNGGASTVGEYQINVGRNANVPSVGYSAGAYGADSYGGGGDLSVANQLRLYSQDSFADDLIFNPRNYGIYYWDESDGTGVRAVLLGDMVGASNPPDYAYQIMVSDISRHVIAFGCSPIGSSAIDPLLVRWSDQESAIDWTPTATNSSGGVVLSSGSYIIGAIKTRQEILIFTDTSIISMRFTATPYVFNFTTVAENVSLVGPNAAVVVGNLVYFMDRTGFFVYDGSVRRIPCPLWDTSTRRAINASQVFKSFAGHNDKFPEIMWFAPVGSGGKAGEPPECNRYWIYNYEENIWYWGNMERGCWMGASSKEYPLAGTAFLGLGDTPPISAINYIYNHEKGYDDDGAVMGEWIESGLMTLDDGDRMMFVQKMIPDFWWEGDYDSAGTEISLYKTDWPNIDPEINDDAFLFNGTYTFGPVDNLAVDYNKYIPTRLRARHVVLRIDGLSEGLGYNWEMGDWRFQIRPDGRKS